MTTPLSFANAARRLSTPLYQYHNAPEVLAGSGLELDDPMDKHSDKIASFSHGQGRVRNGMFAPKTSPVDPVKIRAPLILCGMRPRRFLQVFFVLICICVACLVGGILGNRQLQNNVPVPVDSETTPS